VRVSVGGLASLEPGEFEGIFRPGAPAVAQASAHVAISHVAIARTGERSVAFDARCPHRAADLTVFGMLVGDGLLRCGVHGHVYDLESGRCVDARDCDPAEEHLAVFATFEGDQDELWVLVPDEGGEPGGG